RQHLSNAIASADKKHPFSAVKTPKPGGTFGSNLVAGTIAFAPASTDGAACGERSAWLGFWGGVENRLQDRRQQSPRGFLVLVPLGVGRQTHFFESYLDREQSTPNPSEHDDGQPLPHHQCEAAVDHHFTKVVGVPDETVHAVGNEAAFET